MKKILLFALSFFCCGYTYAETVACSICEVLVDSIGQAGCSMGSCSDEQIVFIMTSVAGRLPLEQRTIAMQVVDAQGYQIAALYNMGLSTAQICQNMGMCAGEGGGSGGTDPDPDCCASCIDTAWADMPTEGYQYRKIASCSSCVCSYTMEYRCAEGWQGSTTDGETGCYPTVCPNNTCCGVIKDTNGSALMNATVVVKHKTTGIISGVVSDDNGFFQLNCQTGDKISFLYIGLVRQDHTVSNPYMDIIMEEDFGEIFCNEGYYMDWSTGASRCIECPPLNNVKGQIPASDSSTYENDISYCYIPDSVQIQDETGSYEYTDNCYY